MATKFNPNGAQPSVPDNDWNTVFPEPRAWALNWDGTAIGQPPNGSLTDKKRYNKQPKS